MRTHFRPTLPHYANGQTIGLLGGTFDPPHAGHLEMSLCALRELNLNAVWWLVSPQNPLKARKANSLEQRMRWCQELTRQHNTIHITDIETSLNTTRTVQTLRRLKRFAPHTQFIWLMGADNLATCHRWENWPVLFTQNKIAIFRRKCYHNNIMNTKAAIRYRHYLQQGKHTLLNNFSDNTNINWARNSRKNAQNNGWVILNNAYHPASSTQIRAASTSFQHSEILL